MLNWSCGDEPAGSIRVTINNSVMKLNFRYREYGGDWEDAEQTVYLTSQTLSQMTLEINHTIHQIYLVGMYFESKGG
jgi:hypothetical protein